MGLLTWTSSPKVIAGFSSLTRLRENTFIVTAVNGILKGGPQMGTCLYGPRLLSCARKQVRNGASWLSQKGGKVPLGNAADSF